MKIKLFYSLLLLITLKSYCQPCYQNEAVTAAYATHGSGKYKDKILWLTWGSTNTSSNPYGKSGVDLGVGSKSFASVHLGANSYLCVEAEIIELNDHPIKTYLPGDYSGDSKDDLYRIEYTNNAPRNNNMLVSGIINKNDKGKPKLKIRCKATINGIPVRIAGLVLADAESLSGTEWIKATAIGDWNVVEVIKNISQGSYQVLKENYSPDTNDSTTSEIDRDIKLNTSKGKSITFRYGNDKTTAALAFLSFNNDATESAYNDNDLSVDFLVEFKGAGATAIALGLLTPYSDLADAPDSYGSSIHVLQTLTISSDGINNGVLTPTNINTESYQEGNLTTNNFLGHLGSTPPDADVVSLHYKLAKKDDDSPVEGSSEEDAWPRDKQNFSYKRNYDINTNFSVDIPYKNGKVGDYIIAWLDFDLNGVFDPDEKVYAKIVTAGNDNVHLEWIIPQTRKPYSTYARIRYVDQFNIPRGLSDLEAITPNSILYYGEVEDHRVYILGPTVTNPMLLNKAL